MEQTLLKKNCEIKLQGPTFLVLRTRESRCFRMGEGQPGGEAGREGSVVPTPALNGAPTPRGKRGSLQGRGLAAQLLSQRACKGGGCAGTSPLDMPPGVASTAPLASSRAASGQVASDRTRGTCQDTILGPHLQC